MINKKLLQSLGLALDKCVPTDEHLNQHGLSGFFYALAITPVIIDPADWMAELFYGERPTLNGKQSKDLKKAVTAVIKASNKSLLKNELKFPYDFSALDDGGFDRHNNDQERDHIDYREHRCGYGCTDRQLTGWCRDQYCQ